MQSKNSGALTTPLAEDVFSLIGIQRHVLHDFLASHRLLSTKEGDSMLVDGLLTVFRHLKQGQAVHRSFFLDTLEESCAAANDFFRMSELMEEVMEDLFETYPFLETAGVDSRDGFVRREGSELVAIFTRDAVYAAERTHVFIMQAVSPSLIRSDLFSERWENEWTNNDVAVALAYDLVDIDLVDIRRFLSDEFLYDKAVVVAAKAMVCFYVQCLIEKAQNIRRQRKLRNRIVRRGEKHAFCHHERALLRIQGDISVLRDFLLDKVKEQTAPWSIINNEFLFLDLIHECLQAKDLASWKSLAIAIHQRIADASVTRHFVGDLWLLSEKQYGKRVIYRAIASLESKGPKERPAAPRSRMSRASLVDMLRAIYNDSNIVSKVIPMCRSMIPAVNIGGQKIVVKQIRTLKSAFEPWEEKQAA
jgi:hypothetical protein